MWGSVRVPEPMGSGPIRCFVVGRPLPVGPARLLLLVVVALLAAGCTEIERKSIRLTPTATAEPGVRMIADNCPGPSEVTLLVRTEVLWQIQAIEDTAATPDDVALFEIRVGEQPENWRTVAPLESPLREGVRYTLQTRPDGQSVDFSLPDLAAGLLFDGEGRRQFNPGLLEESCPEQADVGAFTRDLAVLAALAVVFAALILVVIITVLFIVTRFFSRIRSIEKRLDRERATTSV